MAEVRIKDIDEHEIDTVLAEDIDFEGHLTFKKPLMIKGKFKGEIKSTSALYIGEKAYVEATTEADLVSAKGRHKGDILGHSRVELSSTARVDGNITTPDFVAESGCKFNGYCNMGGDAPAPAQPAGSPTPVSSTSTPPSSAHPSSASPSPVTPSAAAQPSPASPAAKGAPAGAQPQQQKPLFQGGAPGPGSSHPQSGQK